MLLSDEEISKISLSAVTVKDATEDVRAIEAAILSKLAAKELPEPAELKLLVIGANHSYENVGERSFTEAGFLSAAQEIYKLGQSQAHAQGFAAGAAAQLAEKPSAWKWKSNKFHQYIEDYCPPDDAYDEGTLIELYTRRES